MNECLEILEHEEAALDCSDSGHLLSFTFILQKRQMIIVDGGKERCAACMTSELIPVFLCLFHYVTLFLGSISVTQ